MPLYNPPADAGLSNINVSAGTASNNLSAITFSNSNGVSFGLDGSVITGTVATNYQSAGAYLTTAMVSNRGSDFVQATAGFNGTNASGTIASNSISISVGNYITTAMASNRGTDFVQATAAFAGTNASGTVASDGISVSVGNYITTAMLSNRGSDFVQATAAFAGTSASGTIGSAGISVSVGPYITTGMLSNAATISNIKVSAGTSSVNLSAVTFSNANGISFGLDGSTVTGSHNAITTGALSNHSHGVSFTSGSVAFQTLSFTNSNGISFNSGTQGIFGSHNAITTGALSNHSHGNPTLALTNLTGTTASASDGFTLSLSAGAAGGAVTFSGGTSSAALASIVFSNSNGVSFGLNGSTMTGSVAAGAAGTLTNCFEPFDMQDGTATTTCSLSQLNVQPFTLPNNLSFGQINFFGIATVVPTSASNSHSARLTNSTQRYTFGTSYTIGNTCLVDWFLFSRGAGVSTSELQTFASTRNSFATNYFLTYNGGATLTNGAGGSVSGSQTISMTISYPFLTSYTSTSVNPASSYTGYSSGYTTWASGANNSSSFTFSTSAARTLSIASTYPATVGWSGAKRINMNFATSLSGGEYWLGNLRHSSNSVSSSSANAFTGAAGTGNSYSVTFNHTAFAATQLITFIGKTATVINSLGSLGFITTNNMAIEPGLGSFSGTWASNTTYLNNMANPAGAIALTQIRSNVSFFRSWFQMASNMPV